MSGTRDAQVLSARLAVTERTEVSLTQPVQHVLRLLQQTLSAMVTVGDAARISGGKYDGREGTVASVGAKTCKLVIDGKTTGNIPLDAVKVYNAATSAPKITPEATTSIPGTALQEGERAVISGGKYDGQQGVVASVTAKSCTLLIDGKKTGNIPLEAVSRVGAAGAAAAVDVSDSGSSDSGAKVRALAIGASQDPSAEAKQKAVAADVDFREVRYVPRNLAG